MSENTPKVITFAHLIEFLADENEDVESKKIGIYFAVKREVITVPEAIELTLEYLTE